MAYSGTTAATTAAINIPVLIYRPMANQTSTAAVLGATDQTGVVGKRDLGGTGLWYYSSTDGSTSLQAPGYFVDGQKLGMRGGDILFNVSASSLGSTVSNLGVGVLVTTNSTAGFNVAIGAQIQSS